MTAKKKAVKKEPVITTNLYALACDLEQVSIRLEQINSLLSVTAESFFDTKADLLWLGVDLMDTEIAKIDAMVQKIMDVHKEATK